MPNNDREEFLHALREITYQAPTLQSPFERYQETLRIIWLTDCIEDLSKFSDRVRLAEWVRCLTLETAHGEFAVANQHAQLLRIQIRAGSLSHPFHQPPIRGKIVPLTTSLGHEVFSQVPSLPPPGPVAPFMCRKSQDGHAYVAARQIPGKGVLCYLAVSTEPFDD